MWPGDPAVFLEPVASLAAGDPFAVSRLSLSTHTGTHVDPPAHFISGGATVDQLPLDALLGEAVVADLTGRPGPIGPPELESLRLPPGTERLLLKTDNSTRGLALARDRPDRWVGLSPAGAAWLVEHGARLVGADFGSIEEPGASGFPAHLTLLGAGVVLVVGLDLSAVDPGPYTLACLPLRISGGDGAPARAVLIGPAP